MTDAPLARIVELLQHVLDIPLLPMVRPFAALVPRAGCEQGRRVVDMPRVHAPDVGQPSASAAPGDNDGVFDIAHIEQYLASPLEAAEVADALAATPGPHNGDGGDEIKWNVLRA